MTDVDARRIQSGRYSNLEAKPQERFEHWRAHMASVCDMAQPEGARADYAVRSHKWVFDGAMFVAGDYPEVRMAREPAHVRRDQLEHYEIRLRPTATQWVDANGQRLVAAPGQPVLVDSARPNTFRWDPGHSMVMYFERNALESMTRQPLDLHGVVPRGAAATLLAEHLQSMARHLDSMQPEEAQGARVATLHLVAASIAPTADMLALARPAMEASQLRLARRFVEDHLRDPDLGVEPICRQFHLSRSSVYRLFEPLGGVASYIRERRLARIHAVLASSTERRYLGRLADDYGFKSAAQFSRAFREQFGYSPSEARANGVLTPSAVVPSAAAQASNFLAWARVVNAGHP